MTMNTNTLAQDFENVVTDAQDLLKSIGNEGDAKLADAKKRMQGSLKVAKERLVDLQATVSEGARIVATNTDEYVHETPWPAIGVSAARGVLVGFVLARR